LFLKRKKGNEDEAKSFIKELEKCPDSPIRRAVDYLNE